MKVYKYGPIAVSMDKFTDVYIPWNHLLVHFDAQEDGLYFWAEVNPNDKIPEEPAKFIVIGTGWDIPEDCIHLATCQVNSYVWHLYQYIDPDEYERPW